MSRGLLAALAVLCAAALLFALRGEEAPAAAAVPVPATSQEQGRQVADVARPGMVGAPRAGGRTPTAEPKAGAVASPEPVVGGGPVGHVVHISGNAIPHAVVRATGGGTWACNEDGKFQLSGDLPPGSTLEIVDPPDFATLSSPVFPLSSSELVIFGTPLVELEIAVIDQDDAPLPGARVELKMSERAHARVAGVVRRLGLWRERSTTGADGIARARAAKGLGDLELVARLDGYVAGRADWTHPWSPEVELKLHRLESSAGQAVYRGRVVLEGGGAVSGAVVGLNSNETLTDGKGLFELPYWPGDFDPTSSYIDFGENVITVVAEGCSGEVVPLPEDPAEFLTVVLRPSAAIEGHLTFAWGEPCSGWRIKLIDGRVYDRDSQQMYTVEDLAAGHLTPRTTDVDGWFRFEGLLPGRTYQLRAWNLDTLDITLSQPIPSGTESFAFTVPYGAPRARVEGLVMDATGRPIEDCRVRLTMVEHQDENSTWMHSRPAVQTGPDGRFEFLDVPRSELFLRFNASGFPSGRYDLAEDDPGVGLRVVLGEE